MPQNDDPMWPSADEDTASTGPEDTKADGEATIWLPMKGLANGKTEELAVPKVTPSKVAPPEPEPEPEAKAESEPKPEPKPESESWFRPVVEVDDEPDVPEVATPKWSAFEPVTPVEPEKPEPAEPPEKPEKAESEQSEKTIFMKAVQPQRRDKPDWDQFDRAAEPTRPEPTRPEPPAQEQQRREQQRQEQQQRVEPPPPAPVPSATMHAKPVRIEPKEDGFDAEATVGLTQAELPPAETPATEAEAAPKPKKRKVLLIVGLVVVLLLAGLGTAAAMPTVSNRLGLPWAPNAPKGEIPQPAGVTRVLHGPDVNGVSPTKEGLASALKGPVSSADLGTLTGSVIDAATGDVLWEKNSGTPLTPASTTKILVVAAALLSLDHGMQLPTKIVQGADPGTVILVAGGDTSLTALPVGTDSPLYPGAAHVDDLVAQVKKAVGGKISKVQLDVSLFKGPTAAAGWDPEDTAAGSTYMAPVVPVMADGGRNDPKNDHAPRIANPATALTQKIAQKLEAQPAGNTTAPQGAKVLGEVKSPPLPELVNSLLQLSDNMLGDVIARQVAIAKGGEASFTGGAAAVMDVLKGAGFDLTGVQLNDGSGLSDLNKIPAKVLGEILAVAAAPDGQDPRTAKLRPLLAGLPVAGGSGTLADRYGTPASAVGKGWVRGKTGTLSGVNTLAGVVLDTDGRMLVFALMSSGSDQEKGRAALDVVAATLHKCGCR